MVNFTKDVYMISHVLLQHFFETNTIDDSTVNSLFYILDSNEFSLIAGNTLITCLAGLKDCAFNFDHSIRAAWISAFLAKWCGLTIEDCKTTMLLGLLHDVGKIDIPDSILTKPGKLTKNEFEIIKQHPVTGARRLNAGTQLPGKLVAIASAHHERPNGKGYPNGTYQENTIARILSISDIFEAITGIRPYRNPVGYREALDKMMLMADVGDIDNVIFDKFEQNISRILTKQDSGMHDEKRGGFCVH